MLNMETLNEYLTDNNAYFGRQNNSSILKELTNYGLGNAIYDIFMRKDVTGFSNMNELVTILGNGENPKTDNIIFSAKRRYLQYLLTYYINIPLEEFYEEINITDQEVDYGSTKAIDAISNYIKNEVTNEIKR